MHVMDTQKQLHTYNICFCGEIRKKINTLGLKNILSGAMANATIIKKTPLFKYIENFFLQKLKVFR